jgi:pyruvyltransferase
MDHQRKLYWWQGKNNQNFGDALAPKLLKYFTGNKVVFSNAEESEIALIGSIAEHLPESYSGTIAGIGMINNKTFKDFSKANVLALRGSLTLERTNIKNNILLADPGLIAIDLIDTFIKKEYKVGVIAHYVDKDLIARDDELVINVFDPIEKVLHDIASCESIISSSLHGIIVADSLGIPRMWKENKKIIGNGFKFYDYASSIGQDLTPNVWITANPNTILNKQNRLREMMLCL